MSIVTPGSGGFRPVEIEDYTPVALRLESIEVAPGKPFKPGDTAKPRATAVWAVEGDDDNKIVDFFNLSLGQMPDGTLAKCRVLINALAGRARDAAIAGIDDSTLAFWLTDLVVKDGQPTTAPDGAIKVGARVIGIGVRVTDKKGRTNDDGTPVQFYNLTAYKPAKARGIQSDGAGTSSDKPSDPADF